MPEQSSVTTGYSKEGGWPFGSIKDGDPVYKLEKELNDEFPIRKVPHKRWLDAVISSRQWEG